MRSLFRPVGLSILLVSVFIFSCGRTDRPQYHYDQITARTATFVKFENRNLDIYNYDLQAVYNEAIDISQQDTAWQVLLSEIEYPGKAEENYFRAPIDRINFEYCSKAISNFLRQAPNVDIPIFYDVNEKFKMTFYSDSGLVLRDSNSTEYLVPLAEIEDFRNFIDYLPLLIDNGMSAEIKTKFDHVDSMFSIQKEELEKLYTLKRLRVTGQKYRIAKQDARSDRVQIDCIYSVYNPNSVDCIFDATVVLEGKKGTMIHSFKHEEVSVSAKSTQQFTASCVLKSFEAERLGRAIVEVSSFSSPDPRVKKYGKR